MLPMVGATAGASAISIAIRDKARAARVGLLDGGGQAAAYAGDDKQHRSAEQDRLAAEAVCQRPADQMKKCKTGEIGAERQVHMPDVGAQRRHHRGHGGQVHINTQWAKGDQGRQQGQQPGGIGMQLSLGHGSAMLVDASA
jgi:hypothetical protein